MEKNYKEQFDKTFGEQAISLQQILHNTKGNEIMIHFLRIKYYSNGRHEWNCNKVISVSQKMTYMHMVLLICLKESALYK